MIGTSVFDGLLCCWLMAHVLFIGFCLDCWFVFVAAREFGVELV